MHFSAMSDRSLASCVICAKPVPDRAQVCPFCGEGPFVADDPDEDAWFGTDKATEESAGDPVLAAMMAIASTSPKAAPSEADVSPSVPAPILVPSAPAPAVSVPTPQAAADLPDAAMRKPPRPRRLVLGAVAVAVVASLTGAQLHVNDLPFEAHADPAARSSVASIAAQRHSGSEGGAAVRAREAGTPAILNTSAPAARPQGASDRHESAAPTMTTAGQVDSIAGPASEAPPVPTPVAAPAPVDVADAGGTATQRRCAEALFALALCREP